MKKVKVLAALLAALLTLSACTSTNSGSSSASTNSSTESSGAKSSAVSSEAQAEDSNFNETGYPIVNEKITITGFGNQNVTHKDWQDVYCFTKYEELSNIHIEWTTAPNQGYAEKKNVLLAGGEYPDIFYRAGLSVGDQVNYGSKGLLVPMNDLIDQYAPNLTARFEEVPDMKKCVTMPDGNIYAGREYLHPALSFSLRRGYRRVQLDQHPLAGKCDHGNAHHFGRAGGRAGGL